LLKLGVREGKEDLSSKLSTKPGYDGHVSHWYEVDFYSSLCSAKYLIGLVYVFKGADDLHNTAAELQFKL